MRPPLIKVLFAVLLLSWAARAGAVDNVWTEHSSATIRRAPAAAAYGANFHLLGGYDPSDGGGKDSHQVFSVSSLSWSSSTVLPATRYGGDGAVVVSTRLYLVGGWNGGTPVSTLYAYDFSSGAWITTLTGPPTLTACGTTSVVGGKLYVTTACNGAGGYRSMLHSYDIAAGTWTTHANSPAPHYEAAGGAIGTKIYVAGGFDGTNATSQLDVYHTAGSSWTTSVKSMPTARHGTAGAVYDNKLFVLGGTTDGTNTLATVEAFDPLNNTWLCYPSMPAARGWGAAAVVGATTIVYAGGQDSAGAARGDTYVIQNPVPDAPGAPTLSASSPTTTSILWTWTSSCGETSVAVNASTGGAVSGPLSADTTAYTESGLLPSTQYTRSVTVSNVTGSSSSSNVSKYTLAAVPSSVAVTSATPSFVTVSWASSSNGAGTVYELQRSTDGATYSTISTGTALSHTDTGLASQATYYYQVRAVNGESAATAYAAAVSTQTPPFAPATPTGFSGSTATTTSLLWRWTDDASNETGYRVMSGTAASPSGDLAADTTYWLQTGLAPNTQYGPYFARAYNVTGFADSGSDSRYTLAAVPASLAATVHQSSAAVSWSSGANGGGTVYELQRSTDGAAYATISSSTALSYNDSGLTAGTSYWYQVRAHNGEGIATAYTAPLAVLTTPGGTPPEAPTGFAGAGQSSTAILWTWTDNSGVEAGYRVRSGTVSVSGDLAANATSWLQTGLSVNTQYGPYDAQVFNDTGTANSGAGSQYTLAAVPASLAVTFSSISYVSLSWSANGNPAGTSFELQRSTDGASYASVFTGTTTSRTDTGLSGATTYFWRLRAVNGDGLNTAFTAAVSTRTQQIPPPYAPSSLTATASTGSITWAWTDNAVNEDGYRVMSGTTNVSGDLPAGTQSWAQTGLSPNTQYGPYLARAFNAAGTADSSALTRYTLATVPSGSAAASVSSTTLRLSWSRNGSPASTLAEVQRSADGTTFASIMQAAVATLADNNLLGCTSYYYRVRQLNGEGAATAFDSVVNVLTANTIPAPAIGFAAVSAASNRIDLSWTGSPTEGITGYSLYYDAGDGSVDYGSPVAVFTSTVTSYTAGPYVSSGSYTFALRAAHRCGVTETTGAFAAAASTGALAAVRAGIKVPQSGKRVYGNRLTVVAELLAGTIDQVQQVALQYRASGAASWTNVPSANVNHPNPDVQAPYFTHWDVTGLAPGAYDLRAVAYNVAGTDDPAPGYITITADALTPEINENVSAGEIQKTETLTNTVANVIGASGAAADDPVVKIALPAGAVSQSTVTITVVSNPTITTAPPAGLTAIGSSLRIDLSNAQHQLAGGRTAALTFTYPANVADPSTLRIYYLDESTGRWSKDFESVVDTTNRTVTGNTPHFSVFAVFSGVAAAGNLDNVRVYPVPFKPNGGNPDQGKPYSSGDPASGIIFDNLAANTSIKIYTMTGRLVAKLTSSGAAGLVRWDARNDDGRDVASGGYFAVIEAPGFRSVVKKLAVIR